jgi:hypothetical protein
MLTLFLLTLAGVFSVAAMGIMLVAVALIASKPNGAA